MKKLILITAIAALGYGCGEGNPFEGSTPIVLEGEGRVWQFALETYPSGWDLAVGDRLFLGTQPFNAVIGSWILDEREDGTLVFKNFATFLPEASAVRTTMQDLGPISYEDLEVVPEGGYSEVNLPEGLEVIAGHTYAFRESRIVQGVVPVNYAKLQVTRIGQEFPDDPDSRFIEFIWAFQGQPRNRRVVE